jgi:hypothetical protein
MTKYPKYPAWWPADHIGLTARAIRGLHTANVQSMQHLTNLCATGDRLVWCDMLGWPNVGHRTVREYREALNQWQKQQGREFFTGEPIISQGRQLMPKILDRAVSRIEARGVKESSAYPIAVASLQKAGDLKPGSLKATKKGVARGQMSAKQRAATS